MEIVSNLLKDPIPLKKKIWILEGAYVVLNIYCGHATLLDPIVLPQWQTHVIVAFFVANQELFFSVSTMLVG